MRKLLIAGVLLWVSPAYAEIAVVPLTRADCVNWKFRTLEDLKKVIVNEKMGLLPSGTIQEIRHLNQKVAQDIIKRFPQCQDILGDFDQF